MEVRIPLSIFSVNIIQGSFSTTQLDEEHNYVDRVNLNNHDLLLLCCSTLLSDDIT